MAGRYLMIYGGVDSDGVSIEHAAVYDVASALWHILKGIQPRVEAKAAFHCGQVYVMGGRSKLGFDPASASPLVAQTFNFVQASCMDFLGNNQQVCSTRHICSDDAWGSTTPSGSPRPALLTSDDHPRAPSGGFDQTKQPDLSNPH